MTHPTPPVTTPLGLMRLSITEAQALSALAQRVRSHEIDWDGHPWRITLQPRVGDEVLALTADDWWIRLHWGGAAFDLVVPQASAQAWLAARFPELGPVPLPEEFAAAAMEAACAGLLQGLGGLQRGAAHIEALHRGVGELQPLPHHFDLQAQGQEQGVCARLATSSLGLMLMAGLVADLPDTPNTLEVQQVPVRLSAQLGFTWLTPRALSALVPGDTVLLEHVFLKADGSLWMGAGQVGFDVRNDPEGLVALGPLKQGGWTMPEPETQAVIHAGAPLDALMELPLRATFDVGERQVTLAQLQAMQVGQVIALDRPLSPTVSVRVNGVLVAAGELVEIDGRLGVTLTTLAAPIPASDGAAPRPLAEPDPDSPEAGPLDDDIEAWMDQDDEAFKAGGPA